MLTNLRSSAPVYRLRASIRPDSRGEPVRDWAAPERKRIPGAQVQDLSSSATDNSGTLKLATAWTLLITGAFDLQPTDRVEYDGQVWKIDGKPFTRPMLTAGMHTEARLKAVEVR